MSLTGLGEALDDGAQGVAHGDHVEAGLPVGGAPPVLPLALPALPPAPPLPKQSPSSVRPPVLEICRRFLASP